VNADDAPTDDPVIELAARAYLRYLQTVRPDVLWVRLPDREVKRLWPMRTGPGAMRPRAFRPLRGQARPPR
jgi:hypothetical protein